MAERKPIFYDEERRRWRRTRLALEIAGGVFTLVLVVFLLNVGRNPALPELLRSDTHASLRTIRSKSRKTPRGRKRKVAALGKVPQNYDPLRAAFYVSDDYTSLASLQLHYHDLDLLIPEALHAVSADGTLNAEPDPKLAVFLQSLKARNVDLPVMSMVNDYDAKQNTWCPPGTLEMLANPAARERLATQLEEFADAEHQPGIVVDFESLPESSMQDFQHFVHDLSTAVHARGLKLMVALPAADWSYDYKYLASQTDAIILMNYDYRWPTSPDGAGPIAPQDWFVKNIENMVKLVPPSKLIMGIANYGYDWPGKSKAVPHPVAQPVTFQQGVVTAVESGSDILYDPDSLNLHYSYEDENNNVHKVWMLDGVTAYNELRAAERAGVSGTALWRLGMEDPSIWDIWDATHADDPTRAKLQSVPAGYDLILEGDGDIWRITGTPQSGSRTFEYDADSDSFDDESFQSYPMSWRIQQMGAAPKKVALTFDDGPDPAWTPKILDVLKQKQATATFFVIGESANEYDNIVKREYAQGNEIGNHTFTHPEFDTITKSDLQIQLNLTELLLESSLGVKTTLFRPPYGIDHQPETASEIQMLPVPQSMGYVIIGARIDPHDWGEANGGAPPPVDTIVQRVLADVEANKGNIILMHDGGGDRSHTLAALPRVIDGLRAQGYQIVPVADLLGQTRAEMMPPLSHKEWLLARVDAFIFDAFRLLRRGIAFIFIAGILLVSGRAFIIGLLALIEKLRPAPQDHPEYKPEVTVLIPAYNEESVIVDTVRAALASDYPKLEVLVVDDGSADRTSELVLENFGRDRRVRLLQQANGGKPSALNHGLSEASGEIIVSIDADTMVDPEAIPRFVRHFADPRVGAVAGNVKVVNRNRWITRWQALEYITSQNLEKRAFDLLNCIPVVPGAAGAWRADVLRDAGGFSGDTVAEDTDLTLTIRRSGWRILYDEDAIGRTEVPETVDALIRQRFRWTYGTLQAVWKHRDTTGNPRYGTLGWVAIPNIFLFQIILPLVSPVIDLLFLLSLALWGLAQLQVTRLPQLWTSRDVERSLIFFALFMLIDLFTCVVAFALERDEDWTLLAPLILQRFYYRQMMYVVLFRSLKEAVQGRPVGWRGVEPQMPAPPPPVTVAQV
ncbi:MAG: glycosyltransferase [Candidatus Acidiferrales bacterium]|jgi:cellulose synthase/poly-beta-1,6-N-acetylglucosamine synthase-like glycosyltransferase/peptidoglycan/xylan/chitin deacetylase (PgdA/CDA1 family)/spore germination protein YaaH